MQELLINGQPHNLEISEFQMKCCTHRCLQQGHTYEKVEMKGLNVTTQDITVHDTSADTHGVLMNAKEMW